MPNKEGAEMKLVNSMYGGETKDSQDQICYCGCKGKKKPFKTSGDGRGLFCPSCGRMVLDYHWKVVPV
jgi:hypothetical protein